MTRSFVRTNKFQMETKIEDFTIAIFTYLTNKTAKILLMMTQVPKNRKI